MSEPVLGIPAFVRFGHAPLGQGWGLQPERVRHAASGLAWNVTGVLDGWQHPGGLNGADGQAAVAEWWLLEVSGPLPGNPGDRGRFVMEVSRYGDRPGWWITVETRL